MISKAKILSVLATSVSVVPMHSAIKVHTLGDSTMANYDESATVTRGWGMYVQQFLDGATATNYARGGRDAYGGLTELWPTAKKNVAEGDYVIIQFGHNDEKNSGMDGRELYNYYVAQGDTTAAAKVDQRGSVPTTTFKQYLRQIVEEVQAAGAVPVLASPVCRSYFSGNSIKRNGRHDLGDSYSVLTESGIKTNQSVPESDHSMDYAYQMQVLAEEMNVAFLDMTTATKELYESYGASKCQTLLFDGQGSTHFNATGGALVARLWAKLMKEKGLLSDYIKLTSDVNVTPSVAAMGKAYAGQQMTKELLLSGFDMVPTEGTISIEASEGVQISTDGTTWKDNIELSYDAGTTISKLFVSVVLPSEGGIDGKVSITQGTKTISVPVSAEVVELGDGEAVSLTWRLAKNDEYVLTGPAQAIGEKLVGMNVQNYNSPKGGATLWDGVEGGNDDTHPNTYTMQRNLVEGETWPAEEIDDNPDRYIEFGIGAVDGTTLKISRIAMNVAGAGGNGMMCHVYYSTDNWETRTTIFAPAKLVANTIYHIDETPVISVSGDKVVSLRIYPWYNGSATGKTICLSDITFEGVAVSGAEDDNNGGGSTSKEEETTAVKSHVGTQDIQTTTYDLVGRKSNAVRGLVVEVQRDTMGHVVGRKMVMKK